MQVSKHLRMTRKTILSLLFQVTICSSSCQSVNNINSVDDSNQDYLESKYNLHCETHSYGHLPDGWWKWGYTESYTMIKDSTEYVDGKSSIKLKLNENNKVEFAAAVYKIPAIYAGRYLTVTGYIKTKSITEGNAYITAFMRNSDTQVKNKVKSTLVSGTTKWQKYSLTIPYLTNVEWIYIAAELDGNGSAWFDKFEIKIDSTIIK
jgi:erythromycin esterase